MKPLFSLMTLIGVLALTAGCGGQNTRSAETNPVETGTRPTGEGHAAADVVPGSHEDWCAEHQVAETQCTRCDASLIPAFQAAGDWDADHGLPMSQCTIHDPNLEIVRPPKSEGP